MDKKGRVRFELLLRSLTGLELWSIGVSAPPTTAEDDFMRLRARLLVYEALLYEPKESDKE